jgi:hypothetical protein
MKSIYQIKLHFNRYLYFTIILFSLLFYSCENKEKEESIIGIWAIQSLSFENIELINSCYSNLIDFKKNGICDVPLRSIDQDSTLGEYKVEWGADLRIKKIKIISSDTLFNHTFFITNKMLFDPEDGTEPFLSGMTLKSDQVEIVLQGRLSGFY